MDKWTETESINQPEKQDKPSRWWILFHLWGGVCLKAYVDMSGLSKLFLGVPSGSNPASASSYAKTTALVAIGTIVLGYFLSKSLVKMIDSAAMPDKGKNIVKTILPVTYFAGVVFLSMATAPLFASPEDVLKTSFPIVQSSNIKPVMAFTTIQSAEGVKKTDLDQDVLTNLETWIVETTLKKGRNKYAEMGYNPNDFKPKVVANSVYVTAGGKKLAIIKVNMDNSIRSVTIMGIKGNEFHRVGCIRDSNHDIPVWSGVCGNKVREVFGVSIQP